MRLKLCSRRRFIKNVAFIGVTIACVQIILWMINLWSNVDNQEGMFLAHRLPKNRLGDGSLGLHGSEEMNASAAPLNQVNDQPWSHVCPMALSSEVLEVIQRAKSSACRRQLAEVSCLNAQGKLYPASLLRNCPLRSNNGGEYVGCFRDNHEARIFKDFLVETNDENSPTTCINHCLRSGFNLAGLQWRIECWCGTSMAVKSVRLDEERCNTPCPTSSSSTSATTCGGNLTMRVFQTGFGEEEMHRADYVEPPKASSDSVPSVYSGVRIVFVMTVTGRSLRQVTRLLRAIYRPHHYYFIHVDARCDYLHGELAKTAENFANVRMATTRHATIWGSISLLTMLLDCMAELVSMTDWNWDYFLNLSESDYPIKNLSELEAYLTESKGKNFLGFDSGPTPSFIRGQGLHMLFHECDNHVWRLGPKRLQDGIRVDGGSDWICLHLVFVHHIVNDKGALLSGLKSYWNYSILPVESFFHTVLQNSIFCRSIIDNNMRMINWDRDLGCKCQHLHAVDWCGCSPMDFRSSDFQRIKSESGMPTYFGRKFEAVVDQIIVNKVDELVYGSRLPPETPGLNSFWLNEYHHKYPSALDHSAMAFYQGFASLAVKRLKTSTVSCYNASGRLLEATTYMNKSSFSGVVVTVEVLPRNDDKQLFFMEFLLRPSPGFQSIDVQSPFLPRLKRVEVGTNFDVKEQLFRNFAGLFGPTSNISAKLSLGPGKALSFLVHVVSPNGTKYSQDINISSSHKTSIVGHHQLSLDKPLASGIWTLHVLRKGTAYKHVVAYDAGVQFLVAPEWLGFLKLRRSATTFRKSLSAAWRVVQSCSTVGRRAKRSSCAPQTSPCVQTAWSTRYPDPKSRFGPERKNQSLQRW